MFSFASWPVLPVLDQKFLEVLAGIPPATLAYRRAQLDLVSSRFPHMARLPPDRNSHNRIPITPAWHHLLRQRLHHRLRPMLSPLPFDGRERRYYHRVYNLDSPGWRAIREHAAPFLQSLDALFDPAVLNEYLPAPDVTIPVTDVFAETWRKLLLGLALWAREHLALDQASTPHARSTVRCTATS